MHDPIRAGNFEAVYERTGNDNFHTSIYERDHKGLLIARCNQNGQYPWQTTALLNGLSAKREKAVSADGIALILSENEGAGIPFLAVKIAEAVEKSDYLSK